jgi:excisionase family DNA binding protein
MPDTLTTVDASLAQQLEKHLGPAPRPALALVRWSPRPQTSVVWTKEWQDTAIREAADWFGLRITDTVVEGLVSGRNAKERPGLQRALELAEQRDADGNPLIRAVVVADWKRFSRADPGQVISLVNRLRDLGVCVLSNSQRHLVPWADLYWVLVALYAEEAQREAESTARMASNAIREARAAGMDWGRAPLGWKRLAYVGHYTDAEERAAARKDSHWVPDETGGPRSMDVLQKLYELRDAGWSWHHLSRFSGLHQTSIRIALLGVPVPNPDPAGSPRWVWPKPPVRPSNWRNREPVGPAIYDRVIERGTTGSPTVTARQPWLFRGLIHCPFDGSRMSGRDSTRRGLSRRYYVCGSPRVQRGAQLAAYGNVADQIPASAPVEKPHPWSHVPEQPILNALRAQLRKLDFDEAQMAAIERAATTPKRRREVERNQTRRKAIGEQIRKLSKVYIETDMLGDDEFVAQYANLKAARLTIPPDLPEDVLDRIGPAVAAIRQVSDLLPMYADMRDEVAPSAAIIRRLVERIDLTTDRQPVFRWAPPVAETLALARLAGIDTEPPGEEGRDWMSPHEAADAIGVSPTAVARGLAERMIPAERIRHEVLTRYRIPRKWVERQIADPKPLRRPRPVPPATSALTVREAAEHLGIAYRTVLRLIRRGKIQANATGDGRHTRYSIPPESIQSEAVADSVALSRARLLRRSFGRLRTFPPDESQQPAGS